MFAADAIIIADTGNIEVRVPTFTSALRGWRWSPSVSQPGRPGALGMFGGPAPDALMALITLLATLKRCRRRHGRATGSPGYDWAGADFDEQMFRDQAGVLPDQPLIGAGSIASRLYSQPVASVVGIDARGRWGDPTRLCRVPAPRCRCGCRRGRIRKQAQRALAVPDRPGTMGVQVEWSSPVPPATATSLTPRAGVRGDGDRDAHRLRRRHRGDRLRRQYPVGVGADRVSPSGDDSAGRGAGTWPPRSMRRRVWTSANSAMPRLLRPCSSNFLREQGRRSHRAVTAGNFVGIPAEAFEFYDAFAADPTRVGGPRTRTTCATSGPLAALGELAAEFGPHHLYRPLSRCSVQPRQEPLQGPPGMFTEYRHGLGWYLAVGSGADGCRRLVRVDARTGGQVP